MPHPSRLFSRRCLASMMGVVLLCATTACADRPKARRAVTVPPPVALAASPKASTPPAVTKALLGLLEQGGPTPSGDITLREIELGPNGPRAVLAQGDGAMCRNGNCPTGLFDGSPGELRPVLVVMASAVPQVQPTTHLGRPDIGVTSIHSDKLLMVRRYQWNGERYAQARCTVVDRLDQATSPCPGNEGELVTQPTATLCPSLRDFVRQARLQGDPVQPMDRAFVIRDDAQAQVQGWRLAGSHNARTLKPVLQCLREAGLALVPLGEPERHGDLKTMNWGVDERRVGQRRQRFVLSITPVPSQRHSVLSLGAFLL